MAKIKKLGERLRWPTAHELINAGLVVVAFLGLLGLIKAHELALADITPESLFRFLWHESAPEMLWFSLGILAYENLRDRADEQTEQEKLKAKLIKELGSKHNIDKQEAVNQLSVNGWLTDGSLKNASLPFAGLLEINLTEAVLFNVDFRFAGLVRAKLAYAYMPEGMFGFCNLSEADLRNAIIHDADFAGAILTGADLTEAILTRSDFTRANLTGANLTGANFDDAILSDTVFTDATMPDGRKWFDGWTDSRLDPSKE